MEESKGEPRGVYQRYSTVLEKKTQVLTREAQILIVDDNTFNVYSLQLLVEQFFKMPTEIAYSGKEGIQRVKDKLSNGLPPHKLILTDINMPEMDGF